MSKKTVLVAMSGGVDSSVAAFLLKKRGFELIGVTLKTFCYSQVPEGPKSCCGLEGIAAAKAVCSELGIPHLVFDVSKRFKTEVIDDFIEEYACGRTPNPCVKCNASVKIPDLLEKARELGCNSIATGHYARILLKNDQVCLFRGKDRNKDQTYFLWGIPLASLNHVFLPLGDFTKEEVREIARSEGLFTAERRESQEICFVPDNDYVSFLKKFLPPDHPCFSRGKILNLQGKKLCEHEGYANFTIGQRKGLGGGHGKRLFVTEIRPASREVVCGEERDLFSKSFFVDKLNQLVPDSLFDEELEVQIRHRARPIKARRIEKSHSTWLFELSTPAKAITPGQSAVFFLGDQLIGGGRIVTSRSKPTTSKE